MKKYLLIFVILILNLSLYAQQLNTGKIQDENIYIVEDKLNILKSKKDAEVYIEKAFSYLQQNHIYEILLKKEKYSVQLFTRTEENKNIVYLNFFILDYKEDYFYTEEVIVFERNCQLLWIEV